MSPLDDTPEHIAHARHLALEARHARALLLHGVTEGDYTVGDILQRGAYGSTDEVGTHARIAGRIKVGDLVLAVDGVGPVEAGKILGAAGIVDAETRIDKLNQEQRQGIVDAIAQGL